eukprot:6856637-Ditylum_brightwellii.AAC.1
MQPVQNAPHPRVQGQGQHLTLLPQQHRLPTVLTTALQQAPLWRVQQQQCTLPLPRIPAMMGNPTPKQHTPQPSPQA